MDRLFLFRKSWFIWVWNGETNTITFENFELETVDQHGHDFIKNKADTTTSIEGLYVVGDLGSYPDKNYMLAACMTEGSNAAGQAARYLYNTARGQLIVSTHNDVFKTKNIDMVCNTFLDSKGRPKRLFYHSFTWFLQKNGRTFTQDLVIQRYNYFL